jgi:4-amino-4-deoxy-L-arabinose transferase-like glycosyltransferase
MITGTPARLAGRFTSLEPGFVSHFQWGPLLIGLGFTLAWIYVLFRSDVRSPYRSVLYWACGATLVWCLIMTLLLQWIDYGKTYRPIATSMARALGKAFPRGVKCIEGRDLGESQRAALDYHADIVTLRAEVHGDPGCPVLLVQARPGDEDRSLGRQWKRIWEGNRPRDRERYRLYVHSQ